MEATSKESPDRMYRLSGCVTGPVGFVHRYREVWGAKWGYHLKGLGLDTYSCLCNAATCPTSPLSTFCYIPWVPLRPNDLFYATQGSPLSGLIYLGLTMQPSGGSRDLFLAAGFDANNLSKTRPNSEP